ncbi:MAG: DNA alkylation repair protein [Planctomycetota bacterium]|nr:DNA alkylation repair protein [Planctomycetota bacterium]
MSILREMEQRLRAAARPARAGSVDGHSQSALRVLGVTVPDLRAIVRDIAKRTKGEDPANVVGLARRLVGSGTLEARQIAYELLGRRQDVRATLSTRDVEALGHGNDNWKSVDVFACEVSGPCWRDGRVTDAAVKRWARSKDRWWRRTALVSTVPLNMKSRGGIGDAERTLGVCALAVADRDDMVVKALSWALRELGERDPAAVRAFLKKHETALAARVVREVRNKLVSGLKNPRPR